METGLSKRETSFTRVTNTDNDLYAMLADVASQRRDLEAIKKYSSLAEDQARQHGHVLHQAIAHRAWGVMHRIQGDYAEAETRLQQALEIFRTLNTRWQMGRTHLELGELSEMLPDSQAARSHYGEALKAFEDMKAVPAVLMVKERLKSLPA